MQNSGTTGRRWDPEDLFGLQNPQLMRPSCMATDRYDDYLRCKTALGFSFVASVYEDWDTLSRSKLATRARNGILRRIARRSVCWEHGDQIEELWGFWAKVLDEREGTGVDNAVDAANIPGGPPSTETDNAGSWGNLIRLVST